MDTISDSIIHLASILNTWIEDTGFDNRLTGIFMSNEYRGPIKEINGKRMVDDIGLIDIMTDTHWGGDMSISKRGKEILRDLKTLFIIECEEGYVEYINKMLYKHT